VAHLTFLGAARTVTGSKYLLEVPGARVLVDAGLFQGLKWLRERNWQPLPVDPRSIDVIVLTHAHLDHCGFLPRLVSAGYRGRVFCTPGTKELCSVVLPDAGRLQEEDARDANQRGYTRHAPALPLFSEADAFRALGQLQPLGYERPVTIAPGVELEFINAGHLLGSAYARIRLPGAGGRTILFGGDLGRYDRPVLPDPTPVREADVLLVESTYGNRIHDRDDDGAKLAGIVRATVERGGKVVIPAFAIGRVEEVLYWIKKLEDAKRIPVLPVYVDSPMALEALGFYQARLHELDPDLQAAPLESDGRHRAHERELCGFCTQRFQAVASAQQSRELVASRRPAIVVSSSGMATGGRVLNHLEAVLPDPRHTVLFVGYQAAGTRGEKLVNGASVIRMHGRDVPVAAHIERIDSMSAHADSREMLRWLGGFTRPPDMTYLVHGEPAAMDALQAAIRQTLGWPTAAPEHMERVEVAPGTSAVG
jgi:metallo-beta-lactamase family protein